ncbi:MAG: hypothetical protein IKR11_12995 [Solobacterium sp.]|nr:hypothetical protein [Solobacterium sp.]
MIDFLFVLIWLLIIISVATTIISKYKPVQRLNRSSDGHIVPQNQDLTCETKCGHNHGTDSERQPRYIVHEEPQQGYVILNGVKRKISDCKYL